MKEFFDTQQAADRVAESVEGPRSDSDAGPEAVLSPEGVDLTLIRWMLSLEPLERLEVAQATLRSIRRLRREAAED